MVVLVAFGCSPLIRVMRSPFRSETRELKAVRLGIEDCGERLYQVLSALPDPPTPGPSLTDAVNKLKSIAKELADYDKRAGHAMDRIIDAHLRDTSISMGMVVKASNDLHDAGQTIVDAIDEAVDSPFADTATMELNMAAEDIRRRVREAVCSAGFEYYRDQIPVRFVQFVDQESQVLSEDQLQYNIDLANRIFWPGRIRFFIRANIVYTTSDSRTSMSGTRTGITFWIPVETHSSPITRGPRISQWPRPSVPSTIPI